MPRSKQVAQRRKKRVHVPKEAPFPIPTASSSGEEPTPGTWFYYTGYIEGSAVVVKHSGDMDFLYKMGFFGKGTLSRSQPNFQERRQKVNIGLPRPASNESWQASALVQATVMNKRSYLVHRRYKALAEGRTREYKDIVFHEEQQQAFSDSSDEEKDEDKLEDNIASGHNAKVCITEAYKLLSTRSSSAGKGDQAKSAPSAGSSQSTSSVPKAVRPYLVTMLAEVSLLSNEQITTFMQVPQDLDQLEQKYRSMRAAEIAMLKQMYAVQFPGRNFKKGEVIMLDEDESTAGKSSVNQSEEAVVISDSDEEEDGTTEDRGKNKDSAESKRNSWDDYDEGDVEFWGAGTDAVGKASSNKSREISSSAKTRSTEWSVDDPGDKEFWGDGKWGSVKDENALSGSTHGQDSVKDKDAGTTDVKETKCDGVKTKLSLTEDEVTGEIVGPGEPSVIKAGVAEVKGKNEAVDTELKSLEYSTKQSSSNECNESLFATLKKTTEKGEKTSFDSLSQGGNISDSSDSNKISHEKSLDDSDKNKIDSQLLETSASLQVTKMNSTQEDNIDNDFSLEESSVERVMGTTLDDKSGSQKDNEMSDTLGEKQSKGVNNINELSNADDLEQEFRSEETHGSVDAAEKTKISNNEDRSRKLDRDQSAESKNLGKKDGSLNSDKLSLKWNNRQSIEDVTQIGSGAQTPHAGESEMDSLKDPKTASRVVDPDSRDRSQNLEVPENQEEKNSKELSKQRDGANGISSDGSFTPSSSDKDLNEATRSVTVQNGEEPKDSYIDPIPTKNTVAHTEDKPLSGANTKDVFSSHTSSFHSSETQEIFKDDSKRILHKDGNNFLSDGDTTTSVSQKPHVRLEIDGEVPTDLGSMSEPTLRISGNFGTGVESSNEHMSEDNDDSNDSDDVICIESESAEPKKLHNFLSQASKKPSIPVVTKSVTFMSNITETPTYVCANVGFASWDSLLHFNFTGDPSYLPTVMSVSAPAAERETPSTSSHSVADMVYERVYPPIRSLIPSSNSPGAVIKQRLQALPCLTSAYLRVAQNAAVSNISSRDSDSSLGTLKQQDDKRPTVPSSSKQSFPRTKPHPQELVLRTSSVTPSLSSPSSVSSSQVLSGHSSHHPSSSSSSHVPKSTARVIPEHSSITPLQLSMYMKVYQCRQSTDLPSQSYLSLGETVNMGGSENEGNTDAVPKEIEGNTSQDSGMDETSAHLASLSAILTNIKNLSNSGLSPDIPDVREVSEPSTKDYRTLIEEFHRALAHYLPAVGILPATEMFLLEQLLLDLPQGRISLVKENLQIDLMKKRLEHLRKERGVDSLNSARGGEEMMDIDLTAESGNKPNSSRADSVVDLAAEPRNTSNRSVADSTVDLAAEIGNRSNSSSVESLVENSLSEVNESRAAACGEGGGQHPSSSKHEAEHGMLTSKLESEVVDMAGSSQKGSKSSLASIQGSGSRKRKHEVGNENLDIDNLKRTKLADGQPSSLPQPGSSYKNVPSSQEMKDETRDRIGEKDGSSVEHVVRETLEDREGRMSVGESKSVLDSDGNSIMKIDSQVECSDSSMRPSLSSSETASTVALNANPSENKEDLLGNKNFDSGSTNSPSGAMSSDAKNPSVSRHISQSISTENNSNLKLTSVDSEMAEGEDHSTKSNPSVSSNNSQDVTADVTSDNFQPVIQKSSLGVRGGDNSSSAITIDEDNADDDVMISKIDLPGKSIVSRKLSPSQNIFRQAARSPRERVKKSWETNEAKTSDSAIKRKSEQAGISSLSTSLVTASNCINISQSSDEMMESQNCISIDLEEEGQNDKVIARRDSAKSDTSLSQRRNSTESQGTQKANGKKLQRAGSSEDFQICIESSSEDEEEEYVPERVKKSHQASSDVHPYSARDESDGDMFVVANTSDDDDDDEIEDEEEDGSGDAGGSKRLKRRRLEKWRPCLKKDPYPVEERLHLMLEEAFFLSFGLGCLRVLDPEMKLLDLSQMWQQFQVLKEQFIPQYVAYHYFRSKGWVPKSGLKFGCDWILYREGPPFFHGSYSVVVVVVKENTLLPCTRDDGFNFDPRKLSWISLAGLNRITEHVAKELMMCYVIWPNDLTKEAALTPDCITKFKVKEVVVSRWVSSQERENKTEDEAIP